MPGKVRLDIVLKLSHIAYIHVLEVDNYQTNCCVHGQWDAFYPPLFYPEIHSSSCLSGCSKDTDSLASHATATSLIFKGPTTQAEHPEFSAAMQTKHSMCVTLNNYKRCRIRKPTRVPFQHLAWPKGMLYREQQSPQFQFYFLGLQSFKWTQNLKWKDSILVLSQS